MSVQRLRTEAPRTASQTSGAVPRLRAVIREVNRLIAARAPGGVASLACECENRACSEALEVPVPVFRAVDARAELFVVRAGHEQPVTERVVRRDASYAVVQPRRSAD